MADSPEVLNDERIAINENMEEELNAMGPGQQPKSCEVE